MKALHTTESEVKTQKRSKAARLSPDELRGIVSDPEAWVLDAVAEQIIGIPAATLCRWRFEDRGPKYAKLGDRCRYKVRWLLEYLDERIVETRESRRPEVACV